MRLGVCYYPEQWPAERWPVDAALMVETGLELVRIGEFAWSSYEPARDRFAWDWLDRAVDVLAGAGLQIVLGTPTATPPVWLVRERPDILSVGPDGRRRAYGSRRHTCPTSPAYREESRRIVTALAERYGRHEAIVAWQVDNEPGNHDSARCWCDACQDAFTRWLQARHGTVEALNQAWGTAFWSQTYPSFDAVRLPVPTMTAHAPSLLLAHRRFSSQMAAEGLAEQRAVLAARSPGRDLTTNFYIADEHVDQREVAGATRLAAVDSYPHGTDGPLEVAYLLDLARGTAGRGGRGWVMEQQPGPINWTARNPIVGPGQVRVWGWQAALHGFEALLFFRWRAARAGQEQYHSGLLRHDGSPDRGLDEARRLAAELREAPPELLVRPPAPVALLHAYDDAWALEIDPHAPGLTHRDLVLPAYAAARRLGLEVDVLGPEEDLTGYRIVLAPALHLSTPARLERLHAAVDAGALVVVGPRALVKDGEDVWADRPLPAGLADRLGVRVAEHLVNHAWPPPGRDEDGPIRLQGAGCAAGPWVDVVEVHAADVEVLERYAGGHLDGAPAAVRRSGLAYVGCSSPRGWVAILSALLDRPAHPATLEIFERPGGRVTLDHAELELTIP